MRRFSLLVLLALVSAAGVSADETAVQHPLEPASTTSPRATLKSFIKSINDVYDAVEKVGMRRGLLSANQRDFYRNRIFGCLDLSEVPPALKRMQAEEATACLKEVLDRIELPPETEWPDDARVVDEDIALWIIPHTEITIAKVEKGPKQGQYLFTAETVDRAAEFYERVRHLPYQDRSTITPNVIRIYQAEPGIMVPRHWITSLPTWAHRRPGGQAVWQWCGLSLVLLVAMLFMLIAYLIGMRSSRFASGAGLGRYLLTLVFPIIAMAVPLLANAFVKNQLRITGTLLIGLTYFFNVVFLFALMMFVLGVGNRLAALIIATPWITPRGLDAQLIRLTCRVLSIVAAVFVLLEGGQQIGIPLTTLLAGAGVGGLTLALAAQDTLKNVFGSIMISLDKPYRVGERIVAKGYDGVVEEVGLRSTKIRLLSGHLTSIPNEVMARCDIENIGRRPSIRRVSDLTIPLDTPPKKIDRAVDIVREILRDHDGMHPEYPPRVFFNDFNRDSYNIRMMVWYHPANYWDFLAFCQQVNRRIVETFEAEGIQFAPPTNVTYVSRTEDRPLRLHTGDDGVESDPTQRNES